jgi:hypothetical protein
MVVRDPEDQRVLAVEQSHGRLLRSEDSDRAWRRSNRPRGSAGVPARELSLAAAVSALD